MLDILSSPLRGYIAQNLQFYLSKYIEGIQLEGLGLFGGDLVLNDLEIKRHVLVESLEIPSSFDFSRGFIRELRIHIPWTQLLSQPIEVKLYTIELILTARDDAKAPAQRPSRSRSVESTTSTSATRDAPDIETPKSGWLRDTLHKILANVTIQINNLVLKYEQDDMVLSVALGTLDCYAVNDKKGWLRSFTEPQGPTQVISRAIDARDLTIFLDRYTSDRKTSDQHQGGTIHRRVVGYELPVLSRSTISVRARMSLKPGADQSHDSGSKSSAAYTPSQACDPFFQYSVDRRDVIPTTEIDVFIGELAFSLSDRQLEMLGELLQRTMQRQPRKETLPIEDGKCISVDIAHDGAYTEVELGDQGIEESASTVEIQQGAAKKSSWLSWAMETLGGPQDDEEDELISEILAETKEALRRSDEEKKRSAAAAASALKKQMSSSVSDSHQRQPTSRSICCRVCINSTILTLRKHEDDADDASADANAEGPEASVEDQYVPVANVGLVKVSNSMSVKAKLSKSASEVCSLTLTYTALEVVTTRGEVAEPVTDLVFEVERVKMIYLHGVSSRGDATPILAWGQVLDSEQPHASAASSFSECVSHPYFVASFFGEEARSHGQRESRSFEIVKVNQDVEVPVWKTIERRRASTQSMKADVSNASCSCTVLASGKRVPCAPISQLNTVAKTAIASIGVHDRKLDEAALGAAVVKAWEKHCIQESVDFSHLTAGLHEVCGTYHAIRDPDQSAIKNLNQLLFPLLQQLLAENCLHSCQPSKGGDSFDVRARSIHSALRLRYFVAGGPRVEDNKTETAPTQHSFATKETRCGQNIVDASLGPVVLVLKPPQIEDVFELLRLIKSKSTGASPVDSEKSSAPTPAEDRKPSFYAVRLITWHSLNATIPLHSTTLSSTGMRVVEVAGRNVTWLTTKKAKEEGAAWTRKITVGGASARVVAPRERTPTTKPRMDAPLVEILAAKWISGGGADEKAETKSEFGVGRASALIDWSHVWSSATAVDTVLQSFGLRTYGFTEDKFTGTAQSRLICVEICNWQLSRVEKIPREGSFDRVVRTDFASCVVYELHVKSGSMRLIFEGGNIQVPSVSGVSPSGRTQLLTLKLQQSKSTQHSYIDLQGRVAQFELGFESLTRGIADADAFFRSLRDRNASRGDMPSSDLPSKVAAGKKAPYWNMAINLRADGATIHLSPALVADFAPMVIVSDPALHNNRRAAIEPGGSVKVTITCDYIRVKNVWKTSAPSSTADVIYLESISASALYVQDVISSMERTSWDLTLLTTAAYFRIDRLALRHLVRVASVGAGAKRRRGHQERSDQKPQSDHEVQLQPSKHHSVRVSYQIDSLDVSFQSRIASRSRKETTVMPSLRVHQLGIALRKASYRPKSDATELYQGPFTDLQFSIADVDALQVQTSQQWQVPEEQGGRRFGNLARLTEHDFLAVLVCLDFNDLTHIAEAFGSGLVREPGKRSTSPMAAWQSVNRLAREYRSWLDCSPNRAQKLETVATSTLPLFATMKGKVQQGAKAAPVVALYFRDYGDTHDPAKTMIAASMENIDVMLSSSTIAALASLLDFRSRASSNQPNDQDDTPTVQNQVLGHGHVKPAPSSQPTSQPRESIVSIITGRIRIYLPDESWRCHDSELSSDQERVPPSCACIIVDQVTVNSASWCEISLDGLGYPPFNATLLPRCPIKPPQLQRLGSQATIDRGISRRTSRLGNISGTMVKWELSNATSMTDARPIDIKLGQLLRVNIVGHDSEVFLLPFSVTSVDEMRDGGAHTATAVNLTKIRAEVPKRVFDGIVLGVADLLGAVAALQASRHSWKQGGVVHEMSSDVTTKDGSSTSRQMEIVCDGLDAVAVHESVSIHVRLGSLGIEQSSHNGQGSSGEFFVQNLVVASRVSNELVTTREELVLGPNSDPAAWQLNVGNVPEKLVSGRWMAPGRSADGAESSLFIDVQGFQCHGSSHFVDTVTSYMQVGGRDRKRRSERAGSDERASRRGSTTVASLKKKLGVKVLLGPSLVSYWIRDKPTKEISAEKRSAFTALWTGVDQVFVNLEVGSGDDSKSREDFDVHQSLRPINRLISVPVMSIAANVDGLVLRTSASYSPLIVRFKNDTLSAIPGQIHSSWGVFSAVANQSSARTTLLQGGRKCKRQATANA